MSDGNMTMLSRLDPGDMTIEKPGTCLIAEPMLGIAKLQIIAANPDSWFEKALGVAAPPALRKIELGPVSVAWLAPSEWLATGAEQDVEHVRARCAQMAGNLGLMVDLTHARTSFELSGAGARDVMASHCPLDLSHETAPVGAAMRSLFSETEFFVCRQPDREGQPCFRLIFDQVMADYAKRILSATISGRSS